MKKWKNTFIILLISLITLMSSYAIALYDNAKANNLNRYDNLEYYYDHQLEMMVIDLSMQLDEEYQPLNVEGYNSKIIQDELFELIKDNRGFLQIDKYFYYIAKNNITNEVITNIVDYNENEKVNKKDYAYYVEVTYDGNGRCIARGDLTKDIYSNLDDNQLVHEYKYYNEIPEDYSVKINNPKNITIEYMIPLENESLVGISGYANSWEQHVSFVTTVLLAMSLIVILLIIIYPIKYVAIANPFKTIKTWSFEVNIFLWSMIVSLAYVGVITLSSNTINGNITNYINNFGISFSNEIVYIANFVMWSFTLLSIAISSFLIKDIICYGPIKYFKDNTIIFNVYRYFKKQLSTLINIDLNNKIYSNILKIVVVNGLILCVIGSFIAPIAILLVIIYSIILYLILNNKAIKIQKDYDTLLNSIKNIVSEDFDKINKEDFGIFESSKEELSQLSNNFEKAIQDKLKSQKMKTELISNVSHDLKTPLTCIKNYITLLKDDNLSNEDRHHYLEQLSTYSNRLKNLIEDLFEISKVNSGNINLDIQELDIVSLLNEVFIENEELLENKNIELIKHYNSDKCILMLDSNKTYRIFENLLTNISKYAMPNSRAYINLNESIDCVDIEFNNISEDAMDFDVDEITDRFIRGDKSRSKEGSGLGLAIAKSFTEAQGGSFKISTDCDLFKVRISLKK